MPLWGDTDDLAGAPKYETPELTIDGSNSDVVNASADTITFEDHVFLTGDRVLYSASGNTAIAGLTDDELYFVIRADKDSFKLAASLAHAEAGTPVIDITGVGNGSEDAFRVVPDDLYFIDTTEAAVDANRDKGLKTGGWNLFETYTDANSATRYKVEPLVAMRRTAAQAGDDGLTGNTDIEDTTVPDSDP